jgi:putative membrane protein
MSTVTGEAADRKDRTFYLFNAILSVGALSFLAWILMIRKAGGASVDLRFLPAVNASLNATAACLLAAGWIAIRRGARKVHQYLMVSAFAASSLFLVCYLTYHYVHGDTRYAGHGPLRAAYLLVLATHVLLSMAVVPLSLSSFYFALRRSFGRHRKVGKVLLPIWLYVSVTGVVIFFMLRASLPTH